MERSSFVPGRIIHAMVKGLKSEELKPRFLVILACTTSFELICACITTKDVPEELAVDVPTGLLPKVCKIHCGWIRYVPLTEAKLQTQILPLPVLKLVISKAKRF
jgi:mRNA-degrading endonuclease toxin of MazEF toxin-antitoxin module